MKYWDIITPDQLRKRRELRMQELNQRLQDSIDSFAGELIRVELEKRNSEAEERLKQAIDELNRLPEVIYVDNHGRIVGSDTL